jgi:branched-subunit amino acid transport protein
MFDWLPNLPVVWIALVVFAGMALLTAAIYAIVMRLAEGERAGALKAVSPGMLSPMGILFGLIVGFLAVGVWGNVDRAEEALDNEASALRSVVLLSDNLPPDLQVRMRTLIRRHIENAVSDEWPAMEEQHASLASISVPLSEALQLALGLTPQGDGQAAAQRELVASIQGALDARRHRIILSEASINAVKWLGLVVLAALVLMTIALVHSGDRTTAGVAMGVFAAAVAVVITMLASQDQPFSGQLGLDPDVLEEVLPRGSRAQR